MNMSNKRTESDVIVVGAGPSGLFSSLKLNNLKVSIIEKQSFPPRKLCSGILTNAGYEKIKYLNPPDSVFHCPKELFINTVHENIINKNLFSQNYNFCRSGFYNWMKNLFNDNITIYDETDIISISREKELILVKTKSIDFVSKYLIGADGFFSAVRKSLNYKSLNYTLWVQYLIECKEKINYSEIVYDKEISKLFYMMMVPKENNIIVTTNVEKDNYKKIIEKSIERYNTTGKIIKKGIFPITKLKSLTEIETGKDNILLVGESAGFVKPILGDGLSLALETAELAAKSILEGPNNSNLIYKELCIPICEGLQTEIDYLEHI